MIPGARDFRKKMQRDVGNKVKLRILVGQFLKVSLNILVESRALFIF